MKLGIKLLLGYFAISLIFVALGIVIISTTRTISPIVSELNQEIGKFSGALSSADNNAELRSLRRELHDFATDSIIEEQSVNKFNLKAQRLERLLDKTIQQSDNTERELFIRLMKLNKQLILSEKEILSIPEENKLIRAREILRGEYEDLNSEFFDTLVTISNARKTGSQDVFGSLIRISSSIKSNKEKLNTLVNVVLMSIVVVVVLSILLGLYISRSISKPIQELTKASEEFKKGNLNYEVDIKSNDEISQLAKTFNEMRLGLKDRNQLLNSLLKSFKGKFGNLAVIAMRKNIQELAKKNARIINIIPREMAGAIEIGEKLKKRIKEK